MAASYQTGTATSPTNLLTTLVTWLVGQGWTSDSSAADGTGHRAHLHKSGLYVNLRAAGNESIWNYNNAAGYGLGLYLGDAYSGASNWRSQTGGPLASGTANTVGVGMQLPSGSIAAYHFFDNGADHITIVVEKTPGLFVHLGWGPSLVKTGYTTDVPYFFGASPSFYNTSIPVGLAGGTITAFAPTSALWNPNTLYANAFFKVDSATFTPRWISVTKTGSTNNNAGYTGREGRAAAEQSGQVTSSEYPGWVLAGERSWQSAFTGALLLPCHLFVNTQPANRWAPVGYPPTVFYSRAVGHGFGAGEVYQVGGLDYMVFPNFAVRKAA